MQEGYNKPTFGTFILRVLSILLGVFLLGFIIWALVKLVNGSDFWGDLLKIVAIIAVPLIIGVGVWLLIRFLRVNSISFNLGRILGLILGVAVLVFIVWGVIKLADTSDSEGVVDVPDNGSSTTTREASGDLSVDNFGEGGEGADSASDDTADSTDDSAAADDSNSTDDVAGVNTSPNTGPSDSPLPNTGVESVLLPAFSIGALVYSFKRYRNSRDQLKQI